MKADKSVLTHRIRHTAGLEESKQMNVIIWNNFRIKYWKTKFLKKYQKLACVHMQPHALDVLYSVCVCVCVCERSLKPTGLFSACALKDKISFFSFLASFLFLFQSQLMAQSALLSSCISENMCVCAAEIKRARACACMCVCVYVSVKNKVSE